MLCDIYVYFKHLYIQMTNSERHPLPPMEIPFAMPDSGIYSSAEFPQHVDLSKNFLADTHEFKAACSLCFVKTGKTKTINIVQSFLYTAL